VPACSDRNRPSRGAAVYCRVTTAETVPPFDVWHVKMCDAIGAGAVRVGGTSAYLPVVSTGPTATTAPPPGVLPFQQVAVVLSSVGPNQFVDATMVHLPVFTT